MSSHLVLHRSRSLARLLALTCVAAAGLAQAQGAPTIVSSQGQVAVSGNPYSGNGYFKFAVVNQAGNATYWSNDGSSTGGAEPTASVQLTVSNGLFNVLLGDTSLTNMTTLPAAVFGGPDRALRVWFSQDGSSFTQISPDSRIASVPFALQSETASNAISLNGHSDTYYQQRVSASCPSNSAIYAINADGSVQCVPTPTPTNTPTNTPTSTPTSTPSSTPTNTPTATPTPTSTPLIIISTLDSAGNVGLNTSITKGSDGFGLLSYYDLTNGNLKVAHCSNTNCTSSTLNTLDSTGDVGQINSITLGSDNLGLISYYDTTNGDLKVAHCTDQSCTSATISTLDSTGNVGQYSSIIKGSDNLGLISYYDSTNGDLKVAHCTNTNCTSATISTLDSTGNVGIRPSIAKGSDNLGLISYYDSTNGDLKVAHCTNTNCTSATISTLDSATNVGSSNSIAIGADNLGLISYYENAANGSLKTAHCSNTNCTSATLSTIDNSSPNTGLNNSIAIGSDGFGLISYQDNTNGLLRSAHCSNTNCTSATLSTLYTGPFGGAVDSVSITMGADNLGLISYRDAVNTDLKVAHCGSIPCTP